MFSSAAIRASSSSSFPPPRCLLLLGGKPTPAPRPTTTAPLKDRCFSRRKHGNMSGVADGSFPQSPSPRVLAVQSHVVSGYVGNKSATFPLQLLGLEVDPVNSVQLSTHTQYAKGARGQVLDDGQLGELVQGLRDNDLLGTYSHLVTGYIGSDSFLLRVADLVRELKKINPKLVYVCDPVMGDLGPGMYVPKSLLPIYREQVVPLADVCLPNQFEAELLTGDKIRSERDAVRAMRRLHQMGVGTVVLSSAEYGSAVGVGDEKGPLVALASSAADAAAGRYHRVAIPRLDAHFVGTGDLFTALVTAWLARDGGDLAAALEKTIATLQAVLRRTLTWARAAADREGLPKPTSHQMELKLVQSKADIERPEVVVKAEQIAMDD